MNLFVRRGIPLIAAMTSKNLVVAVGTCKMIKASQIRSVENRDR